MLATCAYLIEFNGERGEGEENDDREVGPIVPKRPQDDTQELEHVEWMQHLLHENSHCSEGNHDLIWTIQGTSRCSFRLIGFLCCFGELAYERSVDGNVVSKTIEITRASVINIPLVNKKRDQMKK